MGRLGCETPQSVPEVSKPTHSASQASPNKFMCAKTLQVAQAVGPIPARFLDYKPSEFQSMKHRVHSFYWHGERNRCKANGMSDHESKLRASERAAEGVKLWKSMLT